MKLISTRKILLVCALTLCIGLSCAYRNDGERTGVDSQPSPNNVDLYDETLAAIKKIEPFFSPMREPQEFDWLASFPESGQTFAEYVAGSPTKPTDARQTIYVLPLGTFNSRQVRVITTTADYLAAFFDLPVKMLPRQQIQRPLRIKDHRTIVGHEQLRTGYLIDEVLKPMLPTDAAALIALTNDDLYPDEFMLYVFGQASLDGRVGVWSLYRLQHEANYSTLLRRTLKIAAHETGHMFSMLHCTKYECVMSGSNHVGETDRRPIDACPECMAKVCWFSAVSPADRYRRLAKFCRKNGLDKEAAEFDQKLQAVSVSGSPSQTS